jgi:CBS domain-containing protein
MRVRDLMRPIPRYCSLTDSLTSAGRTMTETGVGALPVLDAAHRVAGMITDRDICCALSVAALGPLELTVADIVSTPVRACRAEDDLSTALATLRAYSVRRLPVIDAEGRLEGLLSLDEIVLAAHSLATNGLGGPVHAEVVETLQAILRPPTSLVEVLATG